MDDVLAQYRQTRKLYAELKAYYSTKFDKDTPFPVVAIYIRDHVRSYRKKRGGKYVYTKPKFKLIVLSLQYLDEIGYPK